MPHPHLKLLPPPTETPRPIRPLADRLANAEGAKAQVAVHAWYDYNLPPLWRRAFRLEK